MEKILGVIPARGNSRGLPRKNIRLLGKKPLVVYTIEAALNSRISRTIVSTENEVIASIALKFGAEVPFLRPEKLAEDTSSSLSVLLHALEYMEKKEGYYADIVVFLQPTSPFRNSTHIDRAIEMLKNSEVESVIGICEVKEHPYFMFLRDEQNNLTEYVTMSKKPLRRQDVPTYFITNAGLAVSRRSYYEDLADPYPVANFASLKGLLMDRISSINIDSELDFEIAQTIISSARMHGQDMMKESQDLSRARENFVVGPRGSFK